MKYIVFVFTYFFAAIFIVQGQTLFTYGTHSVSKKEFLDAYNKNADSTANRQEKMKEYLDLYINFKLKLQAAYDEKVNLNPDLKAEAANFKSQLTDNFFNKQANIEGLLHEAFLRSQKDILVQQVFVQFLPANDSATAFAEISRALDELKTGKKFEEISIQYSNVQEVKDVSGYVGYITVFTLPYSIENIIYNLKPGQYSSIYKSNSGYHIFKNAGERPAAGRRKIQQLLFVTPLFYTDEQIKMQKQHADSVYNLIQAGTAFSTLLPWYGHNYDDNGSDNTIEIKAGDYNSDFEKEVFGLKVAGDISKPFKTQYGYNIIKLVESLPVPNNENNAEFETYLQNQVQNTGRLDAAKRNMMDKWLMVAGFKEANYNKADLWAYTNSALNNEGKPPAMYKGISAGIIIFEFAKKKFTAGDWISYLSSHNVNSKRSETDYENLMNDYIRFSGNEYYKSHIEDYDAAASYQINEFKVANMLFYVMDKYVWSKATGDSAGLKKYYEAHKSNYLWRKSVSALVVSAAERREADSLTLRLKNNPEKWRNIAVQYNDIYIDSMRFNAEELPVKQQLEFKKNFQTKPEINDEGNAYTFIHVLECYEQPAQKNFEEAKGAVINDYQQALEKAWIDSLKKRYAVKVNEDILKTML